MPHDTRRLQRREFDRYGATRLELPIPDQLKRQNVCNNRAEVGYNLVARVSFVMLSFTI